MAGSRVSVLAIAFVLYGAAGAQAQQSHYYGLLTGFVGTARGGDVGDATTTGGASLAVFDDHGLGAEIDVGHTGAFDKDFFADSRVTSFMLNFQAAYPDDRVRPFLNIGAGLLRVRTSHVPGQAGSSHTEAGWNAGAGMLFMFSEALGVRGDVRYFRLFERPEEFVLRDTGFFDYWRSSIGVTLSWPLR